MVRELIFTHERLLLVVKNNHGHVVVVIFDLQ